MMTAFRDTMD